MPNKDRNIPKRRFKAFENADAWELRKLGEVADVFDGTHQTPRYTNQGVMFLSVEDINTLESEKYISSEDFEKEFKIFPEFNDVLMTRIGDIGTSNIVKTNDKIAYYVSLALIKPKKLESHFLNSIIQSKDFQNELWKRTLHIAFPKKINKGEISEVNLKFPTLPEQKTIGTFFSTLDQQITLHQRKLDKLKHVKQAYLSEMFPAEGERVPKRRFPGFTDAWELRKLGECSSLITKGTTPRDKSGVGDVNFVKVENLVNGEILPLQKIQLEEHEGYLKRSQLVENDILFSIAGTLGRTAVVKKSILPANTNQALSIIRGYEFNKNFLVTILRGNVIKEFIKKNPTIGAQPNLSLEQVSNLYFSAPCTEEQSAIGTFFSTLDRQITLHQRKLEKLKNLKKALLNELFV
ncbi:restriction endonuclease subunit S [Streptococcus suis]|nr:restriction endonuclease subunit S [Streptococcus suis]